MYTSDARFFEKNDELLNYKKGDSQLRLFTHSEYYGICFGIYRSTCEKPCIQSRFEAGQEWVQATAIFIAPKIKNQNPRYFEGMEWQMQFDEKFTEIPWGQIFPECD